MPSGTSGSWSCSLRASFLTLFYLFLALTTSVLAQAQDVQLRPSAASDSFPDCGVNCDALAKADDACTPPTVPATNRETYVSCFCQSALITGLKTNAQSVCGTCSQSDAQKVQKWYADFCNSGGKTGSNSGNSNSNNNGNNNNNNNDNDNNNDNNNDASNSNSDSSAGSSSSANKPAPKSWWEGHYKWVVMVIILAAAFTAITIVGIWLKRRHDKKHPNLYHATAGASDSGVFQNRSHDSPIPGPVPGARAPRRHDSMNTNSFASSSRTEYVPPNARQAPAPSRLQKSQGVNDVEIREAQR